MQLKCYVEEFLARQISDNKKENGYEQREICENAEGSMYEKQLSLNKINGHGIKKSRKMLCVENESNTNSKESEMNISCSSNETATVNFHSEVSGNHIECIETTKSESGIGHRAETADNIKSLAVNNNRFGMEMISSEISKTVACSRTSITPLAKRKQESLAVEDIIDEELKQLLAYILNKRQLKGVEVKFFSTCYQIFLFFQFGNLTTFCCLYKPRQHCPISF